MNDSIKGKLNSIRKIDKHYLLHYMSEILRPFRGRMILLLLVNCGISAVSVGLSGLKKWVVDLAELSQPISVVITLMVVLTLVSMIVRLVFSVYTTWVTEKTSFSFRRNLFEKILKSFWGERKNLHSGDYLSRMTSDANTVCSNVINIVVTVGAIIIELVLAFLLLWKYDHSLAILTVAFAPITAAVSILVGLRLRTIQKKIQETEAAYRVFLQEQLTHTDVVQAFNQEENSLVQMDELQKERLYWIARRNRWKLLSSGIIMLIFNGTYLLAFCIGAVKIGEGLITYGTMTAFLSLVGQIQGPVYSAASILTETMSILASMDRIIPVSKLEQEDYINVPSANASSAPIGLTAENLTLAYDAEPIIENVSFTVKPGETVLLAGSSGIGKTTLIRGILGFLRPTGGSLYLTPDGEACSARTRHLVSYVPQGNTIFSGTVADNLKMGKCTATEEEMYSALEAACALEFVKNLPEGLNTKLGERAAGISEGQAQRLAIARAFLKPAGLIILDEATASLDEDTEKIILERFFARADHPTCIFVSHRSGLKKYADHVIRVDKDWSSEDKEYEKTNDCD